MLNLGWTYSNLDRIDIDGSMLIRSFLTWLPTTHPKRSMIECLAQDMFILPSASLISRKAFQAVGGSGLRSLSGYEDIDDLFLRMFRAGVRQPVYRCTVAVKMAGSIRPACLIHPCMAREPEDLQPRSCCVDLSRRTLREVKNYTTSIIAPRFLAQMLAEYRRAL